MNVKRTAAPVTFNKPPGEPGYRWLHVLNGVLLLGLWAFSIIGYAWLPEQIPGHIGAGGVTRWESKDSGLWFLMPIVCTMNCILMYAMSGLANSPPGQGINVPHRERLLRLPKEGQVYAMQPLKLFSFGMATWLIVLLSFVQFQMFSTAVQAQDGEPDVTVLMIGTIVLTVAPLSGMAWIYRSVRVRIEEWETRSAG